MIKSTYFYECLKPDGIKRFCNLVAAYASFKCRPTVVRGKPVMVILETTNHCTLKCEMCVRPKLGSLKLGHLTYDRFVYELDQFPFTANLSLVGLGEPFLNPELLKMVRYAKEVKKIGYVWLSTNGMVLGDIGYGRVMASQLDDILVSFDGASAKTYEKIRIGASFEKLLRNINGLMEHKRKNKGKGPKIILATVASNTNFEELMEVVRVAASLRVDQLLMFTVNSDFPNSEDMVFTDPSLQERKLRAEASRLRLPFFYSKYSECFEPWVRPYVTWEGFVTPCASRPNQEELNFGNIFETPFEKIWNNPRFQEFRASRPAICRRCPRTWNKANR